VQAKVPVLASASEYYSIQYACGVLSANTAPSYGGLVDFNNLYCNVFCADGDGDWRNGCEQGRGYTGGASGYVMGGRYDSLFDNFNYGDANNLPCDADFVGLTSYAGARPACDNRSSGFEYPIPGAWFYQNLSSVSGDTQNYAQLTLPAEQLPAFIAAMKVLAPKVPDNNLNGSNTPYVTSKRAFDCSLLYSTTLLYGPGTAIRGKYDYLPASSSAIYTFGQVNNIDVTKYPLGAVNNICNRTTGLCNYVCASGWDDYDLDPSNGCEADLTGPCGSPLAVQYRSYIQNQACGADCVDCTTLPGSYQLPQPKSVCLAILPQYFTDSPEAKHDHLVNTVRFIHSCTTESIRPQTDDGAGAWQNIVCDPTLCYDLNYDYEDGCELAVEYPLQWGVDLTNASTPHLKKASFNHWYSPIANAAGLHPYRETAYWLRSDGTVVIGRSDPTLPPTLAATDHWVQLFDLMISDPVNQTAANFIWKGYDYYFNTWDVRNLKTYNSLNWGAGGNNIFPFISVTGSYDCSNYVLPSGKGAKIQVGTVNVSVDWTLTTSDAGPWFHVNQSRNAQTECNPGYDPGQVRNVYGRAGYAIDPLKYCAISAANNTAWSQTSTSKACNDAWVWPGAGLCKLNCERNWEDGDMDPTNGCESYAPNGLPLPASRCGTYFNDPLLTISTLMVPTTTTSNFLAVLASACLALISVVSTKEQPHPSPVSTNRVFNLLVSTEVMTSLSPIRTSILLPVNPSLLMLPRFVPSSILVTTTALV